MNMNKLLTLLSRLGILRYGADAGTYRNAAEAPDEFEYMNRPGKRNKTGSEMAGDGPEIHAAVSSPQHESSIPVWLVIITWILGVLWWLLAIGAFAESNNLVGFWMVLAGLVTVHHTSRLMAFVGVDLSPLWRVIVVVVCLLVSVFQL
jgi:hypothetical protein